MATPPITAIVKLCTTNTHTTYVVSYNGHDICTTVTSSPAMVTSWITHIQTTNQPEIVIGIDTEFQNPIATLQLCIGHNCLIYQLIHSPAVPCSLRNFLRDPTCKFSGVGVASDVKLLGRDYELGVARTMDVSRVAADRGMVRVNAGLKEVAKAVLGWDVEKSKEVCLSRWDKEVLDDRQVMYACLDAFWSYQIAKELIALDSEHVDNKTAS